MTKSVKNRKKITLVTISMVIKYNGDIYILRASKMRGKYGIKKMYSSENLDKGDYIDLPNKFHFKALSNFAISKLDIRCGYFGGTMRSYNGYSIHDYLDTIYGGTYERME